ncbi:hypothetical protein [Neisseria leonii]|uniref:hypothetical protein n=1 Tax=Neisseria leonii TaxID=2995413 RepID=UPI00237BD390|nr:hypothetical protein [Neisseria sp. 3986]MDD9325676.1 hypothetical protein [Neisseria sp. 3986]
MKLISNYCGETRLSISFFIDRITPAALYFLPIGMMAAGADKLQLSRYSLFYSLFASFSALPLGFMTAVRYFSAGGNPLTFGSGLLVTGAASLAAVAGYVCYFAFAVYVEGLYEYQSLFFLFAAAIPITAVYYAVSAYNEGRRQVALNNFCAAAAVPLLLLVYFSVSGLLGWEAAVAFAVAFLAVRCAMLGVIWSGRPPSAAADRKHAREIFDYGLYITALFFIQKFVITVLLSFLKYSPAQVAAFQIITGYAMLLSLAANAVFTHAFIALAGQRAAEIGGILAVACLNGAVVLLIALGLPLLGMKAGWLDVLDRDVLTLLRGNMGPVLVYTALEALMMAGITLARGLGDKYRTQSAWCAGVVLYFLFDRRGIGIESCLYAFICGSVLSVAVALRQCQKRLGGMASKHGRIAG